MYYREECKMDWKETIDFNYYLTETYPEIKAKLQETLNSANTFKTTWLGFNHWYEFISIDINQHDIYISADCFMDSADVLDIINDIKESKYLTYEEIDDVIDMWREEYNCDTSVTISVYVKRDSSFEDIITKVNELREWCKDYLEAYYYFLQKLISATKNGSFSLLAKWAYDIYS